MDACLVRTHRLIAIYGNHYPIDGLGSSFADDGDAPAPGGGDAPGDAPDPSAPPVDHPAGGDGDDGDDGDGEGIDGEGDDWEEGESEDQEEDPEVPLIEIEDRDGWDA